jgi:type I restriction enzyme, S subunit
MTYWPVKVLGDWAMTTSGVTPSRDNATYWQPAEIPWVKTGEVDFLPITEVEESISKKALAECSLSLLPPKTVLIAITGEGKTRARSAVLEIQATTNQHCFAILPNETWDPSFLQLWLRASYHDLRKLSSGRGGSRSALSGGQLKALEIPVPERAEQQQIAVCLKTQLAEVETAQQAARRQWQDTTLLRSRLLEQAFSIIDGTVSTTLGDVVLNIQAGKSFQTAEVLARADEMGVLKVSAVTWSEFRADQAKALKAEYEPAESHRVCRGDFLISRANTKELVGAVVLVDRDYPTRLLSDKTLRLVIDEERSIKEFLLFALRAPKARKHIERLATGTSDSMRNIAQGVITSIPIDLPCLTEQRRISNSLKAQFTELDALEATSKAMLSDTDQLAQRILAQAFEN